MNKRKLRKKLTITGSAVALLVLLIFITLGSCQISYVIQAMTAHLRIMHARQPIGKILTDNKTDQKTKEKLKMVLDVRKFAAKELGLPDNKSYTLYSDIKSDYLGWNVYCTPRFSVEPKIWCYPILSTNLRFDSVNLAGLIIHELAHQKLYRKGDSGFSEGFAECSGHSGLLRWRFPKILRKS